MKKSRLFKNRGESGIGTLIIFIAVVLVAAIAASVLLGTTGSLQQKALTTGKQSEREVSGGIQVITMSGSDGTNGTVTNFSIYTKLTAASDPIALSDTLITFDTKNTSQSLSYDPLIGATNATFNITYSKQGREYKYGYISRGDVVEIDFVGDRAVGESELLRLRIIPKHGIIVPVDAVTPDVMTQMRIVLYP
jgi:flagellin-like protein